jgi:hypothetical protein
VAIAIPYTAPNAMRTASLQINPLEYSERVAMSNALGNFNVQLGIRTGSIDKERLPSSNLSMVLVLNEIVQGRAAGLIYISKNRTTIIQFLVVLDDQVKAV